MLHEKSCDSPLVRGGLLIIIRGSRFNRAAVLFRNYAINNVILYGFGPQNNSKNALRIFGMIKALLIMIAVTTG